MKQYTQLDFYHEHYTLVDRNQWRKLHSKYAGGPPIKWWQDTDFLQRFKPDQSERKQVQRAVQIWKPEQDEYIVELQAKLGDKNWSEKAKRFNEEFASILEQPKTADQIGDRWRKVLKQNEIKKSQTHQLRKRKLDALADRFVTLRFLCLLNFHDQITRSL